jgi:outer membrane protein OmpA-like peptidoglycan-associated protein
MEVFHMSAHPSNATQNLCALLLAATLCAGCATMGGSGASSGSDTRATQRDKTAKGAAIGAAAGALIGLATGEREADEILARAAIGAAAGAGVGAYMDHQEEKLARIPGTTVERVSEDTLLIHFHSDILFATDSAVLGSDARASLEQAAQVFAEYPKTAIVIQGHTDSTGTEEHNQSLSERRATAVRNYLVQRGIDSARMVAIGYGESQPIAANDTPDGRQQNRRVDILLKAKAH